MSSVLPFRSPPFRLLIATSFLFSMRAAGQTELVYLDVDDPRPMAEAISSLTRDYPVVITYEDPRLEYSGDVKDVTEQVRNPSNPNNAGKGRILVPRGGRLRVTYEVSQDTGEPVNFASLLGSIVEVNNANPAGGRFGAVRNGDVFHVIPLEARDSSGVWVKQNSILETPVTLCSGELNGYELTEAILREVSEGTGVRVGLAAERFLNTFMRFSGRIEAENEPARDVLSKLLHSMSPRFTWLLNYDPSGKYYVFAVALAAEPPVPDVPPQQPSDEPRPGGPSPVGRRPTQEQPRNPE